MSENNNIYGFNNFFVVATISLAGSIHIGAVYLAVVQATLNRNFIFGKCRTFSHLSYHVLCFGTYFSIQLRAVCSLNCRFNDFIRIVSLKII